MLEQWLYAPRSYRYVVMFRATDSMVMSFFCSKIETTFFLKKIFLKLRRVLFPKLLQHCCQRHKFSIPIPINIIIFIIKMNKSNQKIRNNNILFITKRNVATCANVTLSGLSVFGKLGGIKYEYCANYIRMKTKK